MTPSGNERLVLAGIILNSLLYLCIVGTSLRLLCRIKVRLNLQTKSLFYLNLVALGLRILFALWQFIENSFTVTVGKLIFVFALDSVTFAFYLSSVARVVASWTLTRRFNNQNTQATDLTNLLADEIVTIVLQLEKQLKIALFAYFTLSLMMTTSTVLLQSGIRYKWIQWILICTTCVYYVYQLIVASVFSIKVWQAKVKLSLGIPTCLIVWLFCLSSVLMVTLKNLPFTYDHLDVTQGYWVLCGVSTALFVFIS